MRVIHFLPTVILLAMGASIVIAAPSQPTVSGAVSHGMEITVSGSGFGTKNPAAPQLWAPFEGNLNPSPLGIVQSWRVNQGVAYSASGYSGGGAQIVNSASYSSMLAATLGFNLNDPSQKFYIHRRAKRLYNLGEVGGNGGLKAMKFDYNESYSDNVVLNLTTTQYISQNYGASSYYYLGFNRNNPNWVVEETIGQSNAISNAWANLDFYQDYTKTGAAPPGEITLWENGTQAFNTVTFWRYASSSTLTAAQAPEYWDDLYIDNTWSRVVIGNAETLSGSTHREMQIPTSWGDSSITVVANTGSFSAGDTVYLYVVDQDGSASPPSAPIIVGAQVGSRRLSLAGRPIKLAEPGP